MSGRVPDLTNAQHITVAGNFDASTLNKVAFVFWFRKEAVRIHPLPKSEPASYVISITHETLASMIQTAGDMLSLEMADPDMVKN